MNELINQSINQSKIKALVTSIAIEGRKLEMYLMKGHPKTVDDPLRHVFDVGLERREDLLHRLILQEFLAVHQDAPSVVNFSLNGGIVEEPVT